MIDAFPPKLWMPEKPAIIRAASLKDIEQCGAFMPGFKTKAGIGGNDAFTKLLLHLDTNFTDVSVGGVHGAATVVGDAVNDAANFKFGIGSFKNTTTGYITYPTSTDWNLGAAGSGDFTIDTWMKITTLNSGTAVVCSAADNASAGWEWYLTATNSTLRHSAGTNSTCTTTASTGVWNHWALVRSGGTITLYKDGTSQGTHTDMSMDNESHIFCIGSLDGVGGIIPTINVDEFRLSKGIARWTAGFTPNTGPYS